MMQVAMDSLTTLHEHASRGWKRMARIIWWGMGKEVDGTQHKHTKETCRFNNNPAILKFSSNELETTFSQVGILDKKTNSE
jgi:hypothetical protein